MAENNNYMMLCPHCEAYLPARTFRRHRDTFFDSNANSWEKDRSLANSSSDESAFIEIDDASFSNPPCSLSSLINRIALVTYSTSHCLTMRFGIMFQITKSTKILVKILISHLLRQIRDNVLPTVVWLIAWLFCLPFSGHTSPFRITQWNICYYR